MTVDIIKIRFNYYFLQTFIFITLIIFKYLPLFFQSKNEIIEDSLGIRNNFKL